MEQREDETKAKAQQTHCLTRTKAVHQTSEQSRRSDQIQTNLQQPHGFINAQANTEGGLQSPRRYNPSQTEHEHDSRETFERLHTQQQMPGKDKHQPWGNAALTHRNSQITNKNSSDDEEPIPRQNRDNGYPASSRDNPLTARRDDSSDDDHKPDPSHGIRLEEGDVKLSPRSKKFKNFTVDETEYMSQGDDSDNNISKNETPHRQTTVPGGCPRKEKYPITDTEDSTNKGFPAYTNAPTSSDSTNHKHSIASEHRSGTKNYTNNNSRVCHSRGDPQGQYTKTKGDQTIHTTTNVHYHQEHEDQDGSQPEGAQAMGKTISQRHTENSKLNGFTFTIEEEKYSPTEDITLRLAQTRFRTDKEQNQPGKCVIYQVEQGRS